MKTQKPLLSIGIIFKNEIRCLERCVKSLQPLRDAIPCELVMADTGSDDGSREVAERYADILFDFPWTNDFAAARNAVMDRCSGKWYMTIDADEWLDGDGKELVRALRDKKRTENGMVLTIRNYDTYDMGRSFTDFAAIRLLRMSTGLRYEGVIHERWAFEGEVVVYYLSKTVLHHDGYVTVDIKKIEEKAERNMELLRRELEKKPDDLIVRLQYVESGRNEPNYLEVLRETLEMVDAKEQLWDRIGPPVYRYAVEAACNQNLPELDEWLQRAEELFPDSIFIRVDVEYLMFCHVFKQDNKEETIRRGERYLKAVADRDSIKNVTAQMFSVVKFAAPFWQQHVKILLAAAYATEGKTFDRIPALLKDLDYILMEDSQLTNVLKVLEALQTKSDVDTTPFITEFWDGINIPESSAERAEKRKEIFLKTAARQFSAEYCREEQENEELRRQAYTLYVPLEGRCDLGRGAAVLACDDCAVLEEKLSAVEDWNNFPIYALAHALERGIVFPLPGKTLSLEEMDTLAARLSRDKDGVISLAIQSARRDYTDWEDLVWARGLVLAAVCACNWAETEEASDPERKFQLAGAFAAVERAFIPRFYASDALREETIFALPSMHRFGWYCVQAFDALEIGDTVGYVRFLREGLAAHKGMKKMVEFLSEHTPELEVETVKPDAELRVLAEKIRAILEAYSSNDPAVAALKASPVYQKVAYLIEGEGA